MTTIALSSLTTREAIADILYRATLGLDLNDFDLFRSAIAEGKDTKLHLDGQVMNGIDEIREHMFNNIGPMDTTHMASNIRIDVQDGADTAVMTARVNTQHFKAGDGLKLDSNNLFAGSLYTINAVRDAKDGLWKAQKWTVRFLWLQGTRSVFEA